MSARHDRRAVRRVAPLIGVLLGATLLVPVSPGIARASTPTETQLVLADHNGDITYGVYRRATPTGPESPVVDDSPLLDHFDLTAARDGSRFALVEDVLSPVSGAPVRERVEVYDVSGRLVRVVQDVPAASTRLSHPALSPDGSTVVWSRLSPSAGAPDLLAAPVGDGAPRVVATDASNAVFVDAGTLLVQDSAGSWSTVPLGGGSRTAAGGIPAAASGLTVSADGRSLAWSASTTPAGSSTVTADVVVAPLSGGVPVTVGSPVTVATGLDNVSASFSRDGSTVYVVRDDGTGGPGTVYAVPADGSAPSGSAVTTTGDVAEQAIGVTDDGTPPAAAGRVPALLQGTAAIVRWALPSAADLSGVVVTRQGGGAAGVSWYVPAPRSSLLDTGLVIGQTYTYQVEPVDRSGNLGPTLTEQLVATQAAVSFASPTSASSTHAPFRVRFGPDADGSARFVVDYLDRRTRTWHAWTSAGGAVRVFGAPAAPGVQATRSVPGSTYVFRVRAVDAYGNSTPTVVSTRAVVPYDQTHATWSGATTVRSAAAWLGTAQVLGQGAGYARMTLYGDQFQLIGWRCPTCASVSVYEGRTLVGTVSTYATRTVPRVVLLTRSYRAAGWHTYTVRGHSAPGRPGAYVDGFAMRQ